MRKPRLLVPIAIVLSIPLTIALSACAGAPSALDASGPDAVTDAAAADAGLTDGGPAEGSLADGTAGDLPARDGGAVDRSSDAAPCPPFTIDGWAWELVDVDYIGGAPIYPNLTLDPNDTPVAVFTKGTRNERFAAVSWFSGGAWTAAEIVEQQPGRYLGKRPSLAIDASFGLHVTAYDEDGQNLRYAWRPAPGPWQAEVIYPPSADIDAGDHSSLVFGADGRLHLSFHEYTGHRLIYGVKDAGLWTFEVVAEPGVSSSLALDGSGTPQLAYFTGEHLGYAVRGAAGWVTEPVDESSDAIGHYPTLTLDRDGTPYTAYLRWPADTSAVKVARKLSGTWSTEIVDDNLGITYTTGIALLPCGDLAVAYARTEGVGTGGLWFAYQNPGAGTWSRHSVDSAALASGIDMVVDRRGTVHIIYLDEGTLTLRHARLMRVR